jgi:hypothetical protein
MGRCGAALCVPPSDSKSERKSPRRDFPGAGFTIFAMM